MSALPPEHTQRWYASKVSQYGYDHRGLGFRNRSSQEKRFEALMTLGDFEGQSVLDVGCGFGDFLTFLEQRGVSPVYSGIDVCEPMVERCRECFPLHCENFHRADVLDYQPAHTYDYVVASGLFGLDSPGARERIVPTLERMFSWCRKGVAVNFLSTRYDNPMEGRVYIDPAKALEAALALTPAVRLDHDYLPNDFTLHLLRVPGWHRGEARDA